VTDLLAILIIASCWTLGWLLIADAIEHDGDRRPSPPNIQGEAVETRG
jgi:hypothetical protein